MAGLKKGLGRGLDALLDPYVEVENTSAEGEKKVLDVSIDLIDTNKKQPRKNFDQDSLQELADSIRQHGIVQPLIVVKKKDRYMIVAGERRFRAAHIAGLKMVPVIVTEYDEEQLQEVALIENIQRENLNPVEEASAVRFLMKQHDLTQEEVSVKIGKSRPAVANMLRILNLDDMVLELIKDGKISSGHGRALAALKDSELQKKIALECVRLGYSVRALETRIKNISAEKPVKEKQQKSNDFIAAERKMRDRLGTKVMIDGSEEKGKVTIEYYSKDDLQKIYSYILGE